MTRASPQRIRAFNEHPFDELVVEQTRAIDELIQHARRNLLRFGLLPLTLALFRRKRAGRFGRTLRYGGRLRSDFSDTFRGLRLLRLSRCEAQYNLDPPRFVSRLTPMTRIVGSRLRCAGRHTSARRFLVWS